MERRKHATSLHGQSNYLQQPWNHMYSTQNIQSQSSDPNNDLNLEKTTCNICGYKAKAISHLQIHFRKHTGEKPFHCQHCSFSSAQSNNLKAHIKRVHSPPEIRSTSLAAITGKQFSRADEQLHNKNVSTSPVSQRSMHTLDQTPRILNSCTTNPYSDAYEEMGAPMSQVLYNDSSNNLPCTPTSLPTIAEASTFKASSYINTEISGSEFLWRETLQPHANTAVTSIKSKALHSKSIKISDSGSLSGSTGTFQSQCIAKETQNFIIDQVTTQHQSLENNDNLSTKTQKQKQHDGLASYTEL
ncbi:unnamed protein product [Meganyctiphanes norvegica]|uniref:C2H2-type domain-containing protein n=1 Tax=Meganyctiphanes norvegica TaxID=48144 RepID=A0AAV2PV36_MEGNR